jgi:hypothetical protein
VFSIGGIECVLYSRDSVFYNLIQDIIDLIGHDKLDVRGINVPVYVCAVRGINVPVCACAVRGINVPVCACAVRGINVPVCVCAVRGMNVPVCVCACIYIHTQIHTHKHIHTLYICIYTYIVDLLSYQALYARTCILLLI